MGSVDFGTFKNLDDPLQEFYLLWGFGHTILDVLTHPGDQAIQPKFQ